MDRNRRKRRMMGVVGGAGVVAALGGIFGLYDLRLALFLALAIWILGATLTNLFLG